jgi:hypothetical protein
LEDSPSVLAEKTRKHFETERPKAIRLRSSLGSNNMQSPQETIQQTTCSPSESPHSSNEESDISHMVYVSYNTQAKILEVFAGSESFSNKCRKKGHQVMTPVDKSRGWDLRKPEHQKSLRKS